MQREVWYDAKLSILPCNLHVIRWPKKVTYAYCIYLLNLCHNAAFIFKEFILILSILLQVNAVISFRLFIIQCCIRVIKADCSIGVYLNFKGLYQCMHSLLVYFWVNLPCTMWFFFYQSNAPLQGFRAKGFEPPGNSPKYVVLSV